MCGIVGYIGPEQAQDIILQGLYRLEHRGYDSAGIATVSDNGTIVIVKEAGKVRMLDQALQKQPVFGTVGIGHTRWASHGVVSQNNAHPHSDFSGKITLVHNGIVENQDALRALLGSHSISFASTTDSEVIAQFIGYLYVIENKSFLDSVRTALQQVKGTFALAILCSDIPSQVVVARRGNPMIVGICDGAYVFASEQAVLARHTHRVIHLEDDEIAILTRDNHKFMTLEARTITRETRELEAVLEDLELGEYEHFMRKEIFTQPKSVLTTLDRRLITSGLGDVALGGLRDVEQELAGAEHIIITGCGTAYHAGYIGMHMFEQLPRTSSRVEYASELCYRNPVILPRTLLVAVSQSGETADTLEALREVKRKGATTLGVVNVVGSQIARETDAGVYLHAGTEIGVASTKAFTAQVAVLALMALHLGRKKHLSRERMGELVQTLSQIPKLIERVLQLDPQISLLVKKILDQNGTNWLYMGRGIQYPVALEGALKLKEVSYIHAEGTPAAEMKHGPIAMIDEGMPVVVIIPRDALYDKVLSSVDEVRTRGGHIIAIASEDDTVIEYHAQDVLRIPNIEPLFMPLLTVIPLQLIAYHAAVILGKDVDKPRNLAKCATVH